MHTNITPFAVSAQTSIRQAVAQMDSNRCGVILIVDTDRRLGGVVTDGDVRRAILAGVDFNQSIQELLKRKAGSAYENPVCAAKTDSPEVYLQLLQSHSIFHLPILDSDCKVVGLVTMDDFLPQGQLPLEAVVMAGGFGNRLRPLTLDVPKPMLPIGNRPLLEFIIEQLQQSGIRKVNVTTHYKGEMIENHFKNGSKFGVDISYVAEEEPLGTAGALGLIGESKEPLLVINGDIVTRVDFRRMLEFHREHKADMTVAVRQCDFQMPYGVVEADGVLITKIVEKPTIQKFINAGIYLLNPDVRSLVVNGQRHDMTDLIDMLIKKGGRVVSFPVREYWIDIGHKDQYERVQQDLKELRV